MVRVSQMLREFSRQREALASLASFGCLRILFRLFLELPLLFGAGLCHPMSAETILGEIPKEKRFYFRMNNCFGQSERKDIQDSGFCKANDKNSHSRNGTKGTIGAG